MRKFFAQGLTKWLNMSILSYTYMEVSKPVKGVVQFSIAILRSCFVGVLYPISEKLVLGWIHLVTLSSPRRFRQGHGSPFSPLLLVWIVLALWTNDNRARGIILILGVLNIYFLYARIKSIGQYNMRLMPSITDFVNYFRLISCVWPFRFLLLFLSLAITCLVHSILPFSWVASLEWMGCIPRSLSLNILLQIISARILLLLWNVYCTDAAVLKKKYTYGSYWTSLALPTVNGIGYFLIIYAQWEFAVVLCCKFISPTLEPFLTSPIFCISQRLIAELCWPSGFYHIHKLYHQPPYFGLVHFNHHLQNYVDWVDGIGEGPEEAPLSLASFHQWNPPNFLGDLPILWTFVLSVFDGTAHAYEPPETGSGVDEYKMDQLGFYDTALLMHFYHHLTITLNIASPYGGDLFLDELARDKATHQKVNPLSIADAEDRWKKKMRFVTANK